jgi:hypothetical protein
MCMALQCSVCEDRTGPFSSYGTKAMICQSLIQTGVIDYVIKVKLAANFY